MKYTRPMTAAELMKQLEEDPDYQRRMAEKEQRRTERRAYFQAGMKPILDDLQMIGVDAASIEDMTQRYAPLSPQIIEVILRWLPSVGDSRVKESLIRSLAAASEPFDGQPLVEAFQQDSLEETLRWPIANTIAEARPVNITDWLLEAVMNPVYGTARQMLVIALARLAPPEKARTILLSLLEELPGHVAIALAEVGGGTELDALKNRIDRLNGWKKSEVIRAIQKIECRMRTQNKLNGA